MMNKYKFFLALFLFAVLCPPQNVFGNIDLPESAEGAAAMLTLSEEDEPVRAWATGESTEYYDYDGRTYTLPMYTDGMVTYIVKDPRGDEAVVVGMYENSEYRYNMNAVIPPIINIYGRDYDVTSIGGYAFTAWYNDELWGLTSITIPYSVTYVSGSAFSCSPGLPSCTGLTYIKVDSRNPVYDSRDNCNAIIETSTNTLICGCKNSTIPKSVTSIGVSAFAGSELTSITIPNSVTSIGGWAFYECKSLTNITIPDSVTIIGEWAFNGCTGLTSVTIGNSVTSIGENAFEFCKGLTSITIPNSVTSIGSQAFWCCTGLTSVTIGNSVTSIGYSAFSDCSNLLNIDFGNSTPIIDGGNFVDTPWYENQPEGLVYAGLVAYKYKGTVPEYVTIKEGTKVINPGLFYSSETLMSITIPNSVTSIGSSAFSDCTGLTSITIPNSVTNIGARAFNGCTGLTSITIPNSVTNIGARAFNGCTGLTKVNITDLAAWCNINFNTYWGFESNPLYYAHHLYLNGEEVIELSIPNSVTSIEDGAFYGCTGLTSVTIPNSVTSIGGAAFSGCTGLTSITIPNTVGDIGGNAFSGTPWYKNLPDGLIYIGLVAYEYKGYIPENTSIVIKEGTQSIGDNAFKSCSGLTSITIPNSVNSIGSRAFEFCTGLTKITIPNSVNSIGERVFSRCSSLTSITIPNSVTSIGLYAFENCTGLTRITIPNSVTSIGSNAFAGCI